MSSNLIHTLSAPEHSPSWLNDHLAIKGARAQLRAMLVEGAISPKTNLLNDLFIEKLRQESKKRMGL